jgi:microsomal dipeptidase-like Zn-dependent dipeptidase
MLIPHGPANIETVFRQLDWLVQRYGDTGVAIGSDLGGFDGECTGLENHGQVGRLAGRMTQAGYPDASIARIMGQNWRRFYGRLLAAGR